MTSDLIVLSVSCSIISARHDVYGSVVEFRYTHSNETKVISDFLEDSDASF